MAVVAGSTTLSARTLLSIMRSVKYAEASGFLSVARGIAEANQPVLVAMYLGMICIGIDIILRVRASNTRPSTPAWLLIATLIVSLTVVVLLWTVETTMISSLWLLRGGVMPNASLIEILLGTVFGGGLAISVLVLMASILRVSGAKNGKGQYVFVATLVLILLSVGAFGFYRRNAWIESLYQDRRTQADDIALLKECKKRNWADSINIPLLRSARYS